jgi:2-dehydro-3-deoxyphosphogluconate aldolase/(4S)-4-hydroxy-2-oxoglutarate aldolase
MAVAHRPLAVRRDLLRIFGEDRLVAVIRTGSPLIARQAAQAMSEAGVRLVEITLTVPDAFEIIEELALDDKFAARGSIVGAGTVLSGAQAEQALSAGARFLVSAVLVPEMIRAARARDAMSMPGTMTPTEMIRAAELGADFIKVFPVSAIGGPDFIANVRRALVHLPLVATGNIELDEVPEYLRAGVVGFGVGGPLIRTDLLERDDLGGVIANAERYLNATRRPATN